MRIYFLFATFLSPPDPPLVGPLFALLVSGGGLRCDVTTVPVFSSSFSGDSCTSLRALCDKTIEKKKKEGSYIFNMHVDKNERMERTGRKISNPEFAGSGHAPKNRTIERRHIIRIGYIVSIKHQCCVIPVLRVQFVPQRTSLLIGFLCLSVEKTKLIHKK